MAIKLVVCDIDGTLMERDEILSPAMEELDELLRVNRIPFVLASGRTPPMMAEFTNRLHLTLPAIVCNGSGAYHDGRYLWNEFLDPMELLPVIEYADSLDMAIIICDGNQDMSYRHNDYILEQVKMLGRWGKIYHPGAKEYPEAKIQKLLIIDPLHPGRIDSVIEKLDNSKACFHIIRYDARGMEIMPKGSSKGTALRKLAGYLGIDLKDVLAIGNDINDVDMMEAAGIGAAVADSAEGLKEAADYVCGQKHIYGVIEAVKKFCISQPGEA